METEIFTLCDFAQDNQSKLTIVGTFDSIYSPVFPVVHTSCAIACRIRFSLKETGDHDFRIQLTDEKGKEIIQPVTGTISVRRRQTDSFLPPILLSISISSSLKHPAAFRFLCILTGSGLPDYPCFYPKPPDKAGAAEFF